MANWNSLRFGLFIHWGPYSQMGGSYNGKTFGGNTEWIMHTAKISREDYRKVASEFEPQSYKPAEIVEFAKKSGFRYIIMTAKHYDGFALFDSKVTDFDSVDILPSKRDLLKEFSEACHKGAMPLGFSYSIQRDWFHPGGDTVGPIWDGSQAGSRERYLTKVALPQLRELFTGYGPVFALLPDTERGLSPRVAAAFQEVLSPMVVTPRAFKGPSDYVYTDGLPVDRTLAQVAWEQCCTMSDSWGFRHGKAQWKKSREVIEELVQTSSRGGNYLLNVGLDGDGQFPVEAVSELDKVGKWLNKFGESIYNTSASPFVSHPWVGGATIKRLGKESILYIHLFGKEPRKTLNLKDLVTEPLSVQVMGTEKQLPVAGRPGAWEIDLSGLNYQDEITVIRAKLADDPVVGDGPIVSDGRGRFRLPIGKGIYSSQITRLDRSPTTSGLQLTGFSSEEENATWEVYTDKPAEVKLNLNLDSGPADKVLAVRINDGELSPVSQAIREGPHVQLSSDVIRIPAGNSRIRLSMAAKDTSGQNDSGLPISTSSIELIPSK